MKSRLLVLFLSLTFITCVNAAGNIEAGAKKTETCVACHADDGNSVAPLWPKLAGQHEAYLAKQLKEYRMGEEGPRHEPQMYGMVINLSDEDILDLAAYYSSLEQTPGKALADFVDHGEQVYRGGLISKGVTACIGCHGPKGRGNDLAGFPRVSGQNAEYNQEQLKAFREGRRHNDMNGIMRDIAKRMSDDDIKAVSEYMAGLH